MIALALALIGADLVSSLEEGVPVIRTAREMVNLIPGVDIGPGDAPRWLRIAIDLPLWAIVGAIGLVATLLVRPVD